MPKGFKRDLSATTEAYVSGRLIDSKRRSFISQPKAIPGECKEPKPHLVLFGADKTKARMALFTRERSSCEVCHVTVAWGPEIEGCYVGEWMHLRDKPGQKCDCPENASLRCHAHHQGPGTAHYKRRPRFGERTVQERANAST